MNFLNVKKVDYTVGEVEKIIKDYEKYHWNDLRKTPCDFPMVGEKVLTITNYGRVHYTTVGSAYWEEFINGGLHADEGGIVYPHEEVKDRSIIVGWKYLEPFEVEE